MADKKLKDCPNKFKALEWFGNDNVILLSKQPNKNLLFGEVFHIKKWGGLSDKGFENKMSLIDRNPSLKERTLFMSLFKGGAFMMENLKAGFNRKRIKQALDRDFFFLPCQEYHVFLCGNHIIGTLGAFEDRKNFLPPDSLMDYYLCLVKDKN